MDMRRTLALTLAGVVIALAAGCAAPSNQAGGPVSPSSTDSPSSPSAGPSSPSSVPPASPPAGATKSATPPPGPGQVTLRGRVEEGVEPGCVVLRADNGTTYLLVGADTTIAAPGARVEVVGDLRMDIFTTCQQGDPVAVSRVRRI